MVNSARTESGLGDHESIPLGGQHVRCRHPHVAERDFGVPVLVLVAEDRQVADDGYAGGIAGH